jgi:bisphosphoglycerate-independent phosphoglycerate mutase (AlkP superfamily)
MEKLIPYSVYLPKDYHEKIRELAKERKASGMIRDAICMILDGGDQYKSGYNQGLRDSIKYVRKIQDLKIIAIRGRYVDDIVAQQIEQLEIK